MTEMQFSRLGLISTRPYYWMASPGGYTHMLGVIRLLDWGLQAPNARLGG
jgi:hypothetical protein